MKRVCAADCDTIYTIYLSHCTQSALRTLFEIRAVSVLGRGGEVAITPEKGSELLNCWEISGLFGSYLNYIYWVLTDKCILNVYFTKQPN